MTARPRTVFLTGVTGVIGSVVLRELLWDPMERVVVIVRANSLTEARQRFARVLAFLAIDPAGPLAARAEVVCGDLSETHLGLEARDYGRLTRVVTDIIHVAGNVKLNQPLNLARRDAVVSTQHMIDFAEDCRIQGPFGKCEFVSTVGVCGHMKGAVPETVLPRPRAFRNTYEEAKAESEDLIFKRIEAGFPATIHRPSMVVGDSASGQILHFQVFYYLVEFLLGKRLWGFLPEFGSFLLDIVPVDYVAQAIVISNRCLEANGQIFHLCSGADSGVSMSELGSRIRSLAITRGQPLTTVKTINSTWIWRLISSAGALMPGKAGRAAAALPFLLSYLDDHQTFNNAKTKAFFSSRGLNVPMLDSYLEKILNYYFEAREQKGRRNTDGYVFRPR